MRFAVSPANPADSDVAGAKALTWLDLTVEEEDSYLLVVEGVSDDELGDFELTMHKCMWERDNMTDSAGAPAAELRAYKVVKQPSPAARSPQRSSPSSKKASPVSTKKPLFRAPSPSSSEDEIADELTKQINKLQVSQAAPALVSKASPKTGRTSKIATSPPRQTLPPKSEAPVASSSKGKGKAVEYDPEGTIEPLYGSSRIAAHDTSSREAARKSKTASKVEAPPEPESDLPTRADVAAMIRDPPDEKRLILAESCELHVFDSATLMFMSQANNTLSSLWLVQRKDCNCWLSVTGEDGTFWISQGIDSSTEVSFQEEHRSVIFTVDDASGRGWTWLLKYPDLEQYNRVNNAFQVGIFEAKNGFGSWDKLKVSSLKKVTGHCLTHRCSPKISNTTAMHGQAMLRWRMWSTMWKTRTSKRSMQRKKRRHTRKKNLKQRSQKRKAKKATMRANQVDRLDERRIRFSLSVIKAFLLSFEAI